MIFGVAIFIIGYTIFYWGVSHFGAQRYSLWCLFGLSHQKAGPPAQIAVPGTQPSNTKSSNTQSSGGASQTPSTTPSNTKNSFNPQVTHGTSQNDILGGIINGIKNVVSGKL